MANLNGFDANQVEPTTGFDPVPAGKYLAVITESEMQPTKAGTGSFLIFTLEIIEGEYKRRRLWARLNLDNPNPKAVEIARAELSAICRAVGVLSPKDSTDLHNLPLVVTVKLRKRDDTGDFTNEIRGYSKKAAPPTSGQPATNQTPPWKRP
jgi:hypothetical protein